MDGLWMDGWMDGWVDGWIVNGWMDGLWMDGWIVDGWMDDALPLRMAGFFIIMIFFMIIPQVSAKSQGGSSDCEFFSFFLRVSSRFDSICCRRHMANATLRLRPVVLVPSVVTLPTDALSSSSTDGRNGEGGGSTTNANAPPPITLPVLPTIRKHNYVTVSLPPVLPLCQSRQLLSTQLDILRRTVPSRSVRQ
jgi:hypothetical protein